MRIKKSLSADLEKRKSAFMYVGLTAATAFALSAFVWTSYDYSDPGMALNDELHIITLEEELIPLFKPEKPTPPKPNAIIDRFIIEPDPIIEDPEPDPEPEPVFDPDFSGFEFTDEVPDVVLVTSTGTVDFMKVEKRPHFKDCANILNQEQETQCTHLEIMRFVNRSARYPIICRDRGIEGVVMVDFVINEKGKVVEVKGQPGPDARLIEAAEKAVAQLPEFVPGSQQGRKVRVPYRIPVKFVLK